MRLSPFLFSFSASNRVIHMSSCSLPLCFVYQTSYGMKRKVRDWWDSFWNDGKEAPLREGSRRPWDLGLRHCSLGPKHPTASPWEAVGLAWVSWTTLSPHLKVNTVEVSDSPCSERAEEEGSEMHLKKTRGGSEWKDRPFTVAEACRTTGT